MLNDWLGGQRMRNGHARKNKWEENGTFRLFFCGTRLSEEESGEIPLKGRERDRYRDHGTSQRGTELAMKNPHDRHSEHDPTHFQISLSHLKCRPNPIKPMAGTLCSCFHRSWKRGNKVETGVFYAGTIVDFIHVLANSLMQQDSNSGFSQDSCE